MRMPAIGLCSIVALVLAAASSGHGQTAAGVEGVPAALGRILEKPLPLRAGIGTAHEAVTTSSARAQAFYDQGLAYLHSYVWIEAARSFNEALRADSTVALAHVGLSYALGELGDAEGARRATRTAQALAGKTSGRERVRIQLRASQLQASADPANAAVQAAYRKQLEGAIATYPNDVELLLLVGRAQEPSHEAHGMRVGSAAVQFYQRALAQAPDYFVTHHYLAHAYENSNLAAQALQHAGEFARRAPAVPHARHMFGHALQRVGRMADAIDEFRTADELGSAYLASEQIPEQYDWHYRHNLDLLGTSYQYMGQMQLGERILRRAFDMPSIGRVTEELKRKEWPLFLLARGRAREALAAAGALIDHPAPLVGALGHVLASRSLMALHRLEPAAEAGNNALRRMRALGPPGGILVPDLQLSQGEYLLRTREAVNGRAMLRDAVAKLRTQTGADTWIQTLYVLEGVGRSARELGDWALAHEMAEAMREHDPAYAGTSYAIALVAEQRGDLAAARDRYREVVVRWHAADPALPELLHARRQAAALERGLAAPPR